MRCIGKNIRVYVNDITISYNDLGPDDAPVIIFIHGFPFNKSMWKNQVDVLKRHYRTIAYDIRGHGNSEAGNEIFSIDLFTSDLVKMMDKLGIDTAILCGLSMGGYIALNAVEKYPDRFDALILSDTQCIADSPEIKEKRQKTIQSINEKGVESYATESIKNLFAPASIVSKQKEVNAIWQMIMNTTKKSLCSTLVALAERKETCSTLSEINIPVLIMVGKEDKITPPAMALQMHDKIKNSRMQVLDHAGHLANIENQQEFNSQLKVFVDLASQKSFCLSNTDDNRKINSI
jgi:3-oxoadipate enol-lactonase